MLKDRITTKNIKQRSPYKFKIDKMDCKDENLDIIDQENSSKTISQKNAPFIEQNYTKTKKNIEKSPNVPVYLRQIKNYELESVNNKKLELSALEQRLKNVHAFYKIRVQEERSNNLKRNQLFLILMEELQNNHSGKIYEFKKIIRDAECENNQIDEVDFRLTALMQSFDDIVLKQKELKIKAQVQKRLLLQRKNIYSQKQQKLMMLKEELLQLRANMQYHERNKLKQNRRFKEMIELIDEVI